MTDTNLTNQAALTVAPRPVSANVGPLGRLSVGQKLALSGLTLAIPAGLLLGNTLLSERRQLTEMRQQLAGQGLLEPLATVQNTLRTAGVPALSYLSGNNEALATYKQAVEKVFASLDTALTVAEKNGDAEMTKQLQEIRSNYNALYQDTLKRGIVAPIYSTRSTGIIGGQLSPLFNKVAQDYRLNFTQDQVSADLVRMTTDTLAKRLPAIGYSFGVAINTAAAAEQQGGKLTEVQKVNLANAIQNGEAAQKEIQTLVDNISASDAQISDELKTKFAQLAQATSQDYAEIRARLVDSPQATMSSAAVRQTSATYLPLQYAAYTAANAEIGAVLNQKAAALNRQFLTLLLISLLVSALVTALLYAIARAITRPLQQLTVASRRLSAGDLDVQVPVTTQDEIGILTRSFNNASSQLRTNAEHDAVERAEAQRLQQNVGEFLDVTMDIAEGDLTKRGKVTEDVLGNVVDSINLMTEELGDTLKQVRSASDSVTVGSTQMLSTTQQIEQGAQFTSAEAQRMAERVEQINASIRQMADNAQQSADTARQALLASQEGQEALRSTLDGMQNIRREVQQISKRVKSLGDRSLEIQEIVDTISQIAEQTHLLAVNATIEAAGAGEAGGRFSIVADSVRKLATTSSEATTRIAALIKTVQSEVQDVIVETEEGTREVEQGYRVAATAGEKLQQIGQLTEQSAQFAEGIANATQAQATGVAEVNSTVQQIASVAQESEQAVQQGRRAAEQLQNLAQQLNQNLGRFRLPS